MSGDETTFKCPQPSAAEFITGYFALTALFFIHKHTFLKTKDVFKVFLLEFNFQQIFLQYCEMLQNV